MSTFRVEVEFAAQIDQLKAQLAQVVAGHRQVEAASQAAGTAMERTGAVGTGALRGIEQAAGRTTTAMKGEATGTVQVAEEVDGALNRLLTKVGALGASWKALKSIFGFGEMGIEFNSAMETAQLGIGSLIAAQAKLVDAAGQELKGRQALNVALALSADQMQKLKIAGLETVATTEQLVIAYQQAVGVGLSVGMNLDEIREITIKITQAAAALGVPMNQLAEEVRDLLQGNINPRNTRIATALQITNEEVRKWQAAGGHTLADELNKRMEAFGLAGEKAAQTWQGVTSNVVEASQTLAGAMTQPLFERVKDGLQSILQGVFDLKNARMSEAFDGLVGGGKLLSDALGALIQDALAGLMSLLRDLSAWLKENEAAVRTFTTRLVENARIVGGMLAKALRGVGTLLGWLVELSNNTVVQLTALATVITTVVYPAIATALIPVLQKLALTMAIAGPVQGATIALQSLGRVIVGLVGPWGLAAAAIGAVGLGLTRWAQSYSLAGAEKAGADARMQAEAVETTRTFVDQHNKAKQLEETLRTTAAGSREHAEAQRQMNGIARQMINLYPDLVAWLHKENGEYTNLSEGMEKYAKAKLKVLQINLEYARDALSQAKNEATEAEDFGTGIRKWTGYGFAQWLLVGRGVADNARQEAGERQKSVKAIEQQIEMLKAWDTGKDSPTVLGRPKPKEAEDKSGVISDLEIEARLAAIRASSEEKITLEQQKQRALAQAEREYLQEAARIEKEAREGKFDGNQAGVDALWAANLQRRRDRETAINREFYDKRVAMEADLQARLTAGEEGGLQQRLEAVRKAVEKMRHEAKVLWTAETTEAQKAAQEAEILQAEQALKERARRDQVRADLGKLKQELAELAQIKGHALSFAEQEEVFARFATRSKESAEAVRKLREELHLHGSATQGWFAGIKDWLGQAGNTFQTFKQLASSAMNGVEQAFSRGIAGLLSGQMSLGQAMKAVWQGIAQTVIQAVAQMIARWVAMAIAKRLLGIEENTADGGRTAASLVTATAETWAAYAAIPFAGPILAAAQIASMYASMAASTGMATAAGAKVTAMSVGGLVEKPQFTWLAEKGEPEVVAPQRSFLDWARHLFGMGANLQANLTRNDRIASGYLSQGAGYASEAVEAARASTAGGGGFGGDTIQLSFPGMQVWDQSDRGKEQFGNWAMDAIQVAARRRGQVLVPASAGASF